MKTCRQCGYTKPDDEFRIVGRMLRDVTQHRRMPTCKVCEATKNHAAKLADPYRRSFGQRRRAHASRYGHTVPELIEMGWDLERRSIEMQAQFENGFCPNCIEIENGSTKVHFFRYMSNGLADLTIDRMNPKLPPMWPGNIQWLCGTCNRRKGDRDPILHGQRLQAEHQFRQDEPEDWTLFG